LILDSRQNREIFCSVRSYSHCSRKFGREESHEVFLERGNDYGEAGGGRLKTPCTKEVNPLINENPAADRRNGKGPMEV